MMMQMVGSFAEFEAGHDPGTDIRRSSRGTR
jgi:hypothetical protein